MTSPWRVFLFTLKQCVTNLSCAPFFLVAVLFYAFYYCWPYMAQLPLHLDCAIVDQDQSPLSRRICEALVASPNYNVTTVTTNRPTAVQRMKEDRIAVIIDIPARFERDILEEIPTALTVVSNGAFIVETHTAMTGASAIIGKIADEAIALELAKAGAPLHASKKPPALVHQSMYNTNAGYLSFAVAIVFVIIFQTIMICGFALLLNDWFSRSSKPEALALALASPVHSLAIQLPVMLICIIWIFFVEGFAFAWQGINAFQNIPATILTSLFFSFAVTSLGLLVGFSFAQSHFAIHAVVMTSLPCVFISGNLFPWQDIPAYLRALAWMFPSTPGVDAMLRASQAGATVLEVFPYLLHLLFLGILYFVLARVVGRWRKRLLHPE